MSLNVLREYITALEYYYGMVFNRLTMSAAYLV
jgi:hypothetical protein